MKIMLITYLCKEKIRGESSDFVSFPEPFWIEAIWQGESVNAFIQRILLIDLRCGKLRTLSSLSFSSLAFDSDVSLSLSLGSSLPLSFSSLLSLLDAFSRSFFRRCFSSYSFFTFSISLAISSSLRRFAWPFVSMIGEQKCLSCKCAGHT